MKFPDIDKPLPEPLEMMAHKIAKATHEFWMLDMTRKGYKPGLETDTENGVHAWLVGWHRLPKDIQKQYISKARAMPWIIYRAGMELIFTARATLTLLKDLIKSQRGEHGIDKRKSRRPTTATRPRPGRGKAVQQKKLKAQMNSVKKIAKIRKRPDHPWKPVGLMSIGQQEKPDVKSTL